MQALLLKKFWRRLAWSAHKEKIMPGFFIGTGTSSTDPNAAAEFRRKHRWRVTTGEGMKTNKDWVYLQKAQRPHFKYDEPVVHHNEEEAWFAGKRHWEPITFTFYDNSSDGDISGDIVNWLGGGSGTAVGDWPAANTQDPSAYKKEIVMEMLNGVGTADETWTLQNAWAKEANFNDLDYTNTEIQTITVIVRYDRARRTK
jgi:hypothetical protein